MNSAPASSSRSATCRWKNRSLFVNVSPSRTLREHRFVELGAFRINSLRRFPKVQLHLHPRTSISAISKPKKTSKKSQSSGLETARYYQSLLDSDEVSTRAELSRFLGVSRARVTQVLRRLKSIIPVVQIGTTSRFHSTMSRTVCRSHHAQRLRQRHRVSRRRQRGRPGDEPGRDCE